jgi:peptide/nickel transport system permease protein
VRRALPAGLALLGLLVAATLAGPLIVRTDPLAIDSRRILEPPGRDHLLGTDGLGRDLLARLLDGGRASLAAGCVATLVAVVAGVGLGVLSGIAGRVADVALARTADTFNAFPPLVGALALAGLTTAATGGSDEVRTGLVVGAFAWPALYRFVRTEVLALRRGTAAEAARAIGAGPLRLGVRHLLPLALAPALVPASFIAGGTILVEAALGFLGLGVRPPRPSWGNLLADGMTHAGSAWWLTAFPGLALFATVAALYLVGEALRES